MTPSWKEVHKFVPATLQYIEMKSAVEQPIATPSITKKTPYLPNRQRLLHLIKCLAISETSRKELEVHLQDVTRQKTLLDSKLATIEVEIAAKDETSKSVLHQHTALLNLKKSEIEALNQRLDDLQKEASREALKEKEVEDLKSGPVHALEEKLDLIQDEILNIKIKISNVVKETPKLIPVINLPDETSSMLSTDHLKSIEDIPNLEALLKKIIRSKKNPVDDSAESSKVMPISVAIKQLERELEEKRGMLKEQATFMNGPRDRKDKTPKGFPDPHRDAATSPPSESYLHYAAYKESSRKASKKKESPVVSASSCTCSTCTKSLSWICPQCIPATQARPISTRNARLHGSVLFAQDTSMLKPLVEIVADLEDLESIAYASDGGDELFDVISSLNGF